MRTHELYNLRKHLIFVHHWESDDANALTVDSAAGAHDAIDHTALEHGHS